MAGHRLLWLLPFYESPLRDGGYDIADFFTILPEYGDLEACSRTDRRPIAAASRSSPNSVMNHTRISIRGSKRARLRRRTRRPINTSGTTTRIEYKGSADYLLKISNLPTGPGTRTRGSITGTGSSPTSPT